MLTHEYAVITPGQTQPDPDDIYDDFGLLQERLYPLAARERLAVREVGEWRIQIPDDRLGKTKTMTRWHALRWESSRGYFTSCGRSLPLSETLLRGVADADDMCAVCLRGLTAERWEPGR